jgi:hypothetical protein
MITVDGSFNNISEHLGACRDEEMPEETRECTSMICLEPLEQVFMLFEGSRTVRWYEFGVGALLIAVNNVAFSPERKSFRDASVLRSGHHARRHLGPVSLPKG